MKRPTSAANMLACSAFSVLLLLSTQLVLAQESAPPDSMPFDANAASIMADIAAGNFGNVHAQFDAAMADQLSEEGLATAWRSYQELLGSYQGADAPSAVMRGELTVEQIPVHLAQSDGEVRVVFHPDGSLAGLFFLRPGVPVP